jgi:hypothetical protein
LQELNNKFNKLTKEPENHYKLSYYLEIIALMERVLAFCYTGGAKVLVKPLMHPMWTTLSLLAHTTPMLNPDIIRTQGGEVRVTIANWPMTSANVAASASDRAMSLTYSSHLAQVSHLIYNNK